MRDTHVYIVETEHADGDITETRVQNARGINYEGEYVIFHKGDGSLVGFRSPVRFYPAPTCSCHLHNSLAG